MTEQKVTLVNHITGRTHDVRSAADAVELAAKLGSDHFSVQDEHGKTLHRVVDGKPVDETPAADAGDE
jgi:hypothetical protein